jgi:hypothetical protein
MADGTVINGVKCTDAHDDRELVDHDHDPDAPPEQGAEPTDPGGLP